MTLHLAVGNKNYSSWSLRPWLAMKVAGIDFQETVIPLYGPGSKEAILQFSPAGKVPVLRDGNITVWDSLSILEYLAEKFPDKVLWPRDPRARALARSVSAEMHAGFAALRRECMMNVRRAVGAIALSDEANADIARVDAIWADCRDRFGARGPFLFGPFGAADAIYAPVVSRFEVYAVSVSATAKAYMDAIRALPAWRDWCAAAAQEPWRIDKFEI
jgi:glutathione S-transferase